MRISEIMTDRVVSVRQNETADTAARLLSRNNIGALPVVDDGGKVVGMLTDRDLVVRCMAASFDPKRVPVASIMTSGPVVAHGDEDAGTVSARMGQAQVRRIPVVQDGVLTGIVSLADLAVGHQDRTADTLAEISRNISRR